MRRANLRTEDCGVTIAKLCGDGCGAFARITNSKQRAELLFAYVNRLCDGNNNGYRLTGIGNQRAVLKRLAGVVL